MTGLRTLVLRACANAEKNRYILDEDNEQEAVDMIDQCADIEAYCSSSYDMTLDAIEAVARYVAEYKAGARP